MYTVPGPVSSLNYTVMSNTSARITWSQPEEPNGVIAGYRVVYGVYMRSEGQKSQSTDSNRRTLDIAGLGKYLLVRVDISVSIVLLCRCCILYNRILCNLELPCRH